MRVVLALLFLLALCACTPSVPAQSDLGTALDDYLTNQIGGGFSGAVLVAVDGEVVLRKGYGLADRETNTPNTPETVFQIGSVTKPITATAILNLRDAGLLDVTDPITEYFDDVPGDKRGITLHHLLTHTAGFPGAIGDDYAPISRKAFVEQALATPLNRAPGAGYEYSNVGFSLLAAIVEQLSGQSYDAYLQEGVLGLAGIEHTGYRLPDELPRAHGYNGDRDLGLPTDRAWAEDGPYWHLRGNGGLLSTVDDLYRLHEALEAGEILSEESLALAYTRHTDEGPNSGTHYGYGWALFPAPGGMLVTHNGGDPGFSTDLLRFVDDNKVLIVLSNDRRVEAFDVSEALTQLLFGQTPAPIREPEVQAVTLEDLAASEMGRAGLAFVEAVNAATPEAYRAFMEAHLDDGFRQDPDRLISGFFGAVADEIGHAPITLRRAEWAETDVLHLYADLADGRGYWMELIFQGGGERRIEGMRTDYADPEDVARTPEADVPGAEVDGDDLPDTPAGRLVADLLEALQGDAAARRTFATNQFAEALREGRTVEDLLALLDRIAADLDGPIVGMDAEGPNQVALTTADGLTLTFLVEAEFPAGFDRARPNRSNCAHIVNWFP